MNSSSCTVPARWPHRAVREHALLRALVVPWPRPQRPGDQGIVESPALASSTLCALCRRARYALPQDSTVIVFLLFKPVPRLLEYLVMPPRDAALHVIEHVVKEAVRKHVAAQSHALARNARTTSRITSSAITELPPSPHRIQGSWGPRGQGSCASLAACNRSPPSIRS